MFDELSREGVVMQPQTRAFAVKAGSANEAARTVDVIWTTGATVRRFSWEDGEVDEELTVSGNAVRLERLNAGAPVLDSHLSGQIAAVLGVVESGSVRLQSGQGLATIRFSERADVEPIWRDVLGGIIRNVSVGYRVHQYEVEKRDGQRPLYRAVDWEPFEISIVSIPADPGAQVRGDGNLSASNQCVLTRRNTQTEGNQTMNQMNLDPVAVERSRAADITALCRKFNIDAATEGDMIRTGLSTEKAREKILDTLATRDAAVTTRVMAEVGHSWDAGPGLIDKLSDALGARIAARSGGAYEPTKGREFVDLSLRGLVDHAAKARGESAFSLSQRSWHSGSDFPLIVAGGLSNSVARGFKQAQPALARVARAVPADDYRTHTAISLTASAMPQLVTEGGEVKGITVNEKGEVAAKPDDYAGLFNVTSQALVNDSTALGIFDQINRKMVEGSVNRFRSVLVAPLLANSGAGQTMRDTVALFHATHGNLAAAAAVISVTSLGIARTAMRRQVDSMGSILAIEPRYLVVPPEQETLAQQVVATLQASTVADVNPFAGALEVVTEPALTSTTAWYLAADPTVADGLTYATLGDMTAPRVEARDGWNVLGTELRLVWAVGAAFVETASWFRNAGA